MARTLLGAVGAAIVTVGSAFADDPSHSMKGDASIATLEFVEQGRADTQLLLASLYHTGQPGGAEDDVEAVRCHRLAAEQGLAEHR